jgi:hypothetical protein
MKADLAAWAGALRVAHRAEEADQDQRGHVGVAPDHQLGEEFHVRQFAGRNGEVDRRYYQQGQGGDPEHGRQGARRRGRGLPEMGGDPQPGHHHQQGMLELQRMAAAPEQHLEVDLSPRPAAPRPRTRQRRPGRGLPPPHRGRRPVAAARRGRARPGGDQRAQHGEPEAGAADPQRRIEHRLLQHRNVVVEYRVGTGQEGRHRHHRGADRCQREAGPAHPGQAAAPEGAPDHGGETAMNQIATERSTCTTSAERKKSFSGKTSWMPGVRDKHQQYGEQAGADQRHQAQPQPGPGKASGRPRKS